MKKLELKDLCGYLPYGLKAECQHGNGDMDYKGRIKELTLFNLHKIDGIKYKLILLPLSALTEPMEDGSVPIVELAKISEKEHFVGEFKVSCNADKGYYAVVWIEPESYDTMGFAYTDEQKGFYLRSENKERQLIVENQLQLFEYLFAHHFDIYDLIGQNLAIDKRTIKL